MTSQSKQGLQDSIRVLLSGRESLQRPACNPGSSSYLPRNKCQLCSHPLESEVGGSVPLILEKDLAGIVHQCLLVTESDPLTSTETHRRGLFSCCQCYTSLTTLGNLFKKLEALRGQFNDLRRNIGKLVILGALGKGQSDWESWKEEVSNVEHIFPSCVTGNGHVAILSNETFTFMEKEDAEIIVKEELDMVEDEENSSVNEIVQSIGGLVGNSGEDMDQQESEDSNQMEFSFTVKVEEEDGASEINRDPDLLGNQENVDVNSFQQEQNNSQSDLNSAPTPKPSSSSPSQGWIGNSSRVSEFVEYVKQQKFVCPHCSNPFANRDTLKRHLEFIGRRHYVEFPESSTKIGYYPCTRCNDIYTSEVALTNHMIRTKQKRLKKTFSSVGQGGLNLSSGSKVQSGHKEKEKLLTNVRPVQKEKKTTKLVKKVKEKKFACEYCTKKCVTQNFLDVHTQWMHSDLLKGRK